MSVPRTFDQTSYQPTPLAMDATINGAFEALDGINFDFQPFTVQESLREDSATLERRRFSWETPSTSSYHAISDDTLANGQDSQLYICSPSSILSKACGQLRPLLPDDITGTFVNNHDSLNQRILQWLSKLPDIPWLDVSYVDALDESTGDESSSTTDTEQLRVSTPGTEGLLNYLDFLDTCYENIQPSSPTRGYVDYGRPGLYGSTTDATTALDAYHLTLLQMDASSAFVTKVDRRFRPSMRRQYPREISERPKYLTFPEKEARRSISLVASSRSHD
ncbi:hypothetical protein FPANT_5719 [Fusarium pseudoanthophilum]|uniref:Uncharacterized protein n=1 Tax=Fusarium pseudoanthophilum TaxID=48495 RepID=A0A8H5UIT7_9HYPO|nr:hypothetical protein FPANT_5719 [Fusarium pseudoanthophilum]